MGTERKFPNYRLGKKPSLSFMVQPLQEPVESSCILRTLGLTKARTHGEGLPKERVGTSKTLDCRKTEVEVVLKQVLEKACRDSCTEVQVAMRAPTKRERQDAGSDSINSPTVMIACHRGSGTPSGAATPGRIASAFAVDSALVMSLSS